MDNLSDRLGLDEVKSFAMLLKQSIELGSDIGAGLRSFADDMRNKRMSRAETIANVLPVKLTIPLGLCIFPVILTPVVIKLIRLWTNRRRIICISDRNSALSFRLAWSSLC